MTETATTSDIRCGLSTSLFSASPESSAKHTSSITVSEPHNSDEEGSLSSSSLITMPHAAPERTSLPSVGPTPLVAATRATTVITATTDTLSDVGSDDSDLSIVDVPSSPSLSSAHSDAFEDPHEEPTVPSVLAQGSSNAATANNDFVVVYETETDDADD